VLCLGNAWGARTVDPLDLPQAERPILSESVEDAGYYFNARFYDAERGSFIGRDPKFQFWNPYSYVGGNPLGAVDPWGLESEPVNNPSGICFETNVSNPASADVTIRGTQPSSASWDWGRWGNGVANNALGVADVASLGIGPVLRAAFPDPGDANIDYSSLQYRVGVAEGVAFSFLQGRLSAGGGTVTSNVARSAGAEIQTTAHGAERIAGATATRGGVLTIEELNATKAMGRELIQADGAKVFLVEIAPGRFNAVVENANGKLITIMGNWSQKSIARIARNYGWKL